MSKEVKRYLYYTFTLTWGLWGGIALANKFSLLEYGTPLMMIFFVSGGLIPTISAIWLKKKFNKNEDYKAFLKSIVNIKHHPGWYLLVFILAFSFIFIQYLTGGATIENPIYLIFLLFPAMIIGGGLEEIGWRGYLQPALQKNFNPFFSTLIVGIIWTVWHIPLWYINGSNQADMNFIYFIISVLALAFLLATIYITTQSIFLCITFHALINSFWEIFVPNNNILPVLISLAFAIVIYQGSQVLQKKRIML